MMEKFCDYFHIVINIKIIVNIILFLISILIFIEIYLGFRYNNKNNIKWKQINIYSNYCENFFGL